MNRHPITIIKILFLGLTILFLFSYSDNPPNGRTGAPGEANCAPCHNGGGFNGNVSISGIPSTISPNTTYTVTLTNNVTSGSPSTGGFQIVALDEDNNNIGDLQDISSDVRTNTESGREYAEQDGAKSYGGSSSVSWTFEWTSPATAPQNGDITFYYSMNMTNGQGNTSGDKVLNSNTTVNLPSAGDPLSVTVNKINDVSCFGDSDGAAIAIASDGSGSYSYQWTNGATSASVNNLSAGTNFVTVTDSDGASVVGSVIINQPSPLNANVTTTDVSCNGEDDGLAVVIPFGGTSPYQFLWIDGTTTASNTDLEAGTYSVTVTDSENCQLVETVTISEPSAIDITISTDNEISCFGDSNGALSASVSGGSPPYNYIWSTGAPTSSISGLSAGVYTVTVTDNNDCEEIQGITLASPSLLNLSLSSTDETAPNANDGTATASASGGTSPYDYLWSTGETESFIENLAPGTYTVTITDDEGCTEEGSVTILEVPCALVATFTSSDPLCFGGADGQIDIQVTGAVGQIDYSWSHDAGLNGPSASNLSAGTYTVTVADEALCSQVLVVTLGQPTGIIISSAITDVSCPDVCDGSIDLSISGGTGPYSVLWSNGVSESSTTDLCPGLYTVTVTDANACIETSTFTIQNASPISATYTITDVSCFGGADGSIDLIPSGGTGTYSFNWSNTAITEDVNGLSEGTYIVTITDGNSCVFTDSVVVGSPAELSVEAIVSNESGNNANDGSIALTVDGGVSPYSYAWSNNESTSTISNLSPGQYTATVTDANLCEIIITENILAFDCLLSLDPIVNNPSCFGASDGSINIEVVNGNPPYVYDWSNGLDTDGLTDIPAGTYSLTLTDALNCVVSADIILEEPEELVVSSSFTVPSCAGNCDGTIELLVFGGTAPYTYIWSNDVTSSDLTSLCAGTYTVTVTDSNGCEAATSVVLEDPLGLEVDINFEDPGCDGSIGDLIWVDVFNNQGAYDVTWFPAELVGDTISIEDVDYSILVLDENGCSLEQAVAYTFVDVLSVTAGITPVSSVGANDASISLEVIGGVGPYTYIWNTEDETSNLENIAPGEYSVDITDSEGCTVDFSVIIDEFDCNLSVEAILSNPLCLNDTSGSIQLVLENFLGPVEYEWSNGITEELLSDIPVGLYSVSLEDANGCAFSGTYELVAEDNTAPELNTGFIIANLDESGDFTLQDEDLIAFLVDDCDIVELEYFPKEFNCADIGENLIDLTACDLNGNCFTGTIMLELSDDIAPEVICPEDAFIPYCLESYTYDLFASDNCDSDPVLVLVSGLESGSNFPFGETTVIYNVEDATGNISECVFNVIKEGNDGIEIEFSAFVTEMLPGDTLVVEEPIIDLNALTSTDGLTFAWYNEGVLVSELPNAEDLDLLDFEFLELEISFADLCIENYYFEINLNTSSSEISKQVLDCYPIPTDNFLYIKGWNADVLSVDVFDLKGNQLELNAQKISDNRLLLELSDLEPNIYFVRVSFKDSIQIMKVIVL